MSESSGPVDPVDLDLTRSKTSGALPQAVDADGVPVDQVDAAGRVFGAGAALTPVHLPDLPRGDWTKTGGEGGRGRVSDLLANKTAIKAVLVSLLVLLVVPLLLVLVTMLQRLSSGPAG